MHRVLLLVFLSHATFFATAAGGCRDRQCGSTSVPYPFGFSGDCPILLRCNATASTPLLPTRSTMAAAAYPVTSFNSSTSTFVVSMVASCIRSVSDARASLIGPCYGVSSHTGLFLRRGCRVSASGHSSDCSVPDDVLSVQLQKAQCGADSGNDTAAWTCVSSPPPAPNSPAAARGEGQFLLWDKVDDAGCEDVLTSAVYASTPVGVPSVEFAVVELGWWLNGTCGSATSSGQCAQNATCHDVETPSGAWGHRCTCVNGMSGDGLVAGDGCHYDQDAPAPGKLALIAGVVSAASIAFLLCIGLSVWSCLRHRRKRQNLMVVRKTAKQALVEDKR